MPSEYIDPTQKQTAYNKNKRIIATMAKWKYQSSKNGNTVEEEQQNMPNKVQTIFIERYDTDKRKNQLNFSFWLITLKPFGVCTTSCPFRSANVYFSFWFSFSSFEFTVRFFFSFFWCVLFGACVWISVCACVLKIVSVCFSSSLFLFVGLSFFFPRFASVQSSSCPVLTHFLYIKLYKTKNDMMKTKL